MERIGVNRTEVGVLPDVSTASERAGGCQQNRDTHIISTTLPLAATRAG